MTHFTVGFEGISDVIGPARQGESYAFVPILLFTDLPPRTELSHSLQDHLADTRLPAVDQFYDEWGMLRDSGWVRARLPILFGFAPPQAPAIDPKPSLVNCGFAAVDRSAVGDGWPVYCFACTDNEELEAALLFPLPFPATDIQARVAQDFWNVLLARPEDLSDFDDFVLVGTDVDRSPCRVAYSHGKFTVDQIGDAVG